MKECEVFSHKKKCSKCGKMKPLTDFHKDTHKKSGFRSSCKECDRKRQRIYIKNNKEKIRLYAKKYRAKNGDYLQKKSKEYYRNHLDYYKEQNRKYRLKNIQDPKFVYREMKYGAAGRGHSFELTFDEFLSVWRKPCHYCGGPSKGLDRIDNNQGYKKDNVVPCCKACNFMKRDLSANDFVSRCKIISEKHETPGWWIIVEDGSGVFFLS